MATFGLDPTTGQYGMMGPPGPQVGQPGVAQPGPSQPNQNGLVQDPVTGQWYDPANHAYFQGDNTQIKRGAMDPGEQSISNEDRANRLLTQGFGTDQSLIATPYAGLGQLGQSLQNTISNPNASSVAQSQQTGAFDQLGRTQLAGAAGVGGNNAAAARRQAMLNIGNTGSELAQRQATLRAQEVSAAQGRLGEVLGQQAQVGLGQRGQDIGAAGQYAGYSSAASGVVSDINQKDRTANKQLVAGGIGGAAGALGNIFGGGGAAA